MAYRKKKARYKRGTKAKKKRKTRKARKKPSRKGASKRTRKKVMKRPRKRARKAVRKRAKMPKKPPIEKVDDEKVFGWFKKRRIPVVPTVFCRSERRLPESIKKMKYPLVMKVSGRTLIHKSDVRGVMLGIRSNEEAAAAFSRLMKIKGAEKVMIQKQVGGMELILGAKSDPNFGYVVSIGFGGKYVEILKDVTFRISPITTDDAKKMVSELRGHEILEGARGERPVNLQKLYDVLVKISKFAVENKIKEMDINPLFCTPEGCYAADIRIIK